jgi:ubiquinone/menaquinone biosynthesis C-methylase UbiE
MADNKKTTKYLNVVYAEKAKPYTKYPSQLCKYLFNRFGMKPGDKILDIGCGRGDFSRGFKNLGLNVSCLDKDVSLSGLRKELLEGIELKQADFEKDIFPYPDETFDFVFSKSVIEHLISPEHFISEGYRVLKKGGRKIIMAPDWKSQIYVFYNDYTHVRPYLPNGIADLLKIHNFKDVHAEIFYQLPALWKHPWLKIFSRLLQVLGPVKKIHKNKIMRWSRELMILGSGLK